MARTRRILLPRRMCLVTLSSLPLATIPLATAAGVIVWHFISTWRGDRS